MLYSQCTSDEARETPELKSKESKTMKSINIKKALDTTRTINAYSTYIANRAGWSGIEDDLSALTAKFAAESAELAAATRDAQQGARVRTITATDIVSALIDITDKLDINQSAMEGVTATVDCNAQRFPHCYNGRPESTVFAAIYKRGAWIVTDIHRAECKRIRVRMDLTDTARAALAAKYDRF